MDSLFPEAMLQRIENCGVIAVLVIDEPENAVPLARALLACGIDAMELTLRTPGAVEALRIVRQQVPNAGRCRDDLRPEQVEEVVDAGAAFGVAPGLNLKVVERAKQLGLPFAPGIVTPSSLNWRWKLVGRTEVFFGGAEWWNQISPQHVCTLRPFGTSVLPLVASVLITGRLFVRSAVPAIGGSWLAP